MNFIVKIVIFSTGLMRRNSWLA